MATIHKYKMLVLAVHTLSRAILMPRHTGWREPEPVRWHMHTGRSELTDQMSMSPEFYSTSVVRNFSNYWILVDSISKVYLTEVMHITAIYQLYGDAASGVFSLLATWQDYCKLAQRTNVKNIRSIPLLRRLLYTKHYSRDEIRRGIAAAKRDRTDYPQAFLTRKACMTIFSLI